MINTGDPVQAFDRWGHVFYGVIGFNRAMPQNGSIFAARYDWPVPSTTPDYRFTALVARGAPALSGKFEDKVQLEVDRGVNSPYAGSLARPWGNVYICWAQFVGNHGNNGVYFSAPPTAASRTRSRRRSPRACTAASSATSASPASAPSTSRGARSRAAAATR